MADAKEMNTGDLDAKIYEVSFQVPASLGEEGATVAFDRIKALISSHGALIAEGAPRRMALSSEMTRDVSGKKERHMEGFFSWVKYEATPNSAPEIEAALKKDTDVIRSLIIITVRDSGPSTRFLSSDRLDGETIRKRETVEVGKGPVSEEELNKSIEQLVGPTV